MECIEWLKKTHPALFEQHYKDYKQEVQQLQQQHEQQKQADAEKPAKKKKLRVKESDMVTIKVKTRVGKKCLTLITGLERHSKRLEMIRRHRPEGGREAPEQEVRLRRAH